MSKAQEIQQVLQAFLETVGYEIVRVSLSKGARPTLQVMLDRLDGQGVTLDDCTSASRKVSTLLDVENLLASSYVLEVTSPGVDRPLIKREDFKRFSGQHVRIDTLPDEQGRKRFQGILKDVEDKGVALSLGGGEIINVDWGQICQAKLAPQPSQIPKSNATRRRQRDKTRGGPTDQRKSRKELSPSKPASASHMSKRTRFGLGTNKVTRRQEWKRK